MFDRAKVVAPRSIQHLDDCVNPPTAPGGHQPPPLRRRADSGDALVLAVRVARHEPARLKVLHHARHRRRPDLLRAGEIAERHRSAENDDR